MKDKRLRGELKECLPITAKAKRFPLKKEKSTVIAERKKFSSIIGHAITVRKSQGITLAYMQGDLNRSTGKKIDPNCKTEELSITYISGSILYLTFPCQKPRLSFYC